MARTKYHDRFPELAREYAHDGFTDAQIAARLGIATSTFYEYRRLHPEFDDAVSGGKQDLDDDIENRLMDLALGHCNVTTVVTDHEGRTRTTVRTIPPNIRAIVYWLEKRTPVRRRPPETEVRAREQQSLETDLRHWMNLLRPEPEAGPEVRPAIEPENAEDRKTPETVTAVSPSEAVAVAEDNDGAAAEEHAPELNRSPKCPGKPREEGETEADGAETPSGDPETYRPEEETVQAEAPPGSELTGP